MADFPALTGFYKFLFFYFEPGASEALALIIALAILIFSDLSASTLIPLAMTVLPGGTAGMHHLLVPSDAPAPASLDPRTHMAMCHMVGRTYTSWIAIITNIDENAPCAPSVSVHRLNVDFRVSSCEGRAGEQSHRSRTCCWRSLGCVGYC